MCHPGPDTHLLHVHFTHPCTCRKISVWAVFFLPSGICSRSQAQSISILVRGSHLDIPRRAPWGHTASWLIDCPSNLLQNANKDLSICSLQSRPPATCIMNAALSLSFRSLDPLQPSHPDSHLKKKKKKKKKREKKKKKWVKKIDGL